MMTWETNKDNEAWQKAKAEIAAQYPYDTNFGRDFSPKFLWMIATRAQEIKTGVRK